MSTTALKAAVTGKPNLATTEKPQTVGALLTSESFKQQMALALPKHMTADRLARIALTEVRRVPKLAQCVPASFAGAIMTCASLGLEPGSALGHAYILPFKKNKKEGNKWTSTMEAQLIIGYRGMLDLARRSGQILSFEARIVHEADRFHVAFGLESKLEHEPDWEVADRGPLRFVYAVAKLKDGGTQFEVMSRAEIEKIRASSKSAEDGPWVTHFEEMAKKTVIRRLFKYLPVSIEMQRAVGLDEQAEAGVTQQHGNMVIDGSFTVVEDPEQDQGQEQAQDPAGADESEGPALTYAAVREAIEKSPDTDTLAIAADLLGQVANPEQRAELTTLYRARLDQLTEQSA